MRPASDHPILEEWTYRPKQAAACKARLISMPDLPRGFTLDAFEESSAEVIRIVFFELRELILRSHRLIDKADRQYPPPVPMKDFDDYSTAAEDAYDEFLRPINEAIQKLSSIHPNWTSPLPSSSHIDSSPSNVDADGSPPQSLVLPDSGHWPQAGSSLLATHDSSAHTFRSSSKRPRFRISDELLDIEYGSAGTSGSDTRHDSGRDPKRSKGSAL
jgi:hypothetical protein